jgi:hypothetical protein
MLRWVLGLLVVVVVAAPVALADRAADEAAAAQRAQLAQEERDWGRRLRDESAGLAGDYARLGGFAKDDFEQHKAACDAEAAAHDKIAEAYDRNAPQAEIIELRRAADRVGKAKLVWRERIVEYRVRQSTAAPSEEWWQELARWAPKETLGEMLAWSEARKAAAEAWGRTAEACVPGSDWAELARLKDAAYAADAEREIAEWRFTWARDRERVWENKKIASEDLTRTVAKLQQLQEERIKVRRDEIERDRRAREVERAMRSADAEFHKAFEAAQREYERRRREDAARR